MKKKVLILFPQPHIAFSPTTLGLYDALAPYFDVTVFCPLPRDQKKADIKERNTQYFRFNTKRSSKLKALPLFLLQKAKRLLGIHAISGGLNIYDFVRFSEYRKALKSITGEYDEIIAVDMMMLFLSQSFFKKAYFLSLELTDSELPFLRATNKSFIEAVIVQTQKRYEYLFGSSVLKTFFVQNAPVFNNSTPKPKIKNSLLFNGRAGPAFGLYRCLKFIRKYSGFTLTIQGTVLEEDKENNAKEYGNLIADKKVCIVSDYMEQQEMLDFMGSYEIGFCFYDFSYPKINTFNYRTAPSGKMFTYFAAGVPVIGNRSDGLQPINDFNAGILIDDFEPETILNAVKLIQCNYEYYEKNCSKAAEHYSFDKNITPFISYLIEKSE